MFKGTFYFLLQTIVFVHHLELTEVGWHIWTSWGNRQPLQHRDSCGKYQRHKEVYSMHLSKTGGKYITVPVVLVSLNSPLFYL